ncbi:MAG: HAMP domain-containing protein [Sphingobacteriaceae bacterium]|nr:MAG: HAMP domain-containing protein [Sphingobacteriaceae bacterium]
MPTQFFRNTSIANKLYFTIGIMAFLIVIELCVLSFSLNTLSSIRAFVSGEGLWSKAQKDAFANLRLYAESGRENEYQDYQNHLKVPLGDGIFRKALEKPVPDYNLARVGLLQGRNDAEDISGMINLILRFHDNTYLARTIYYWQKAETSLKKIIPVGRQLYDARKTGSITSDQVINFQNQIDQINDEVTPSEDGFSYTLGEGSRWLEHLVLHILIALALTVEIIGILIAVSISRNLQKGLAAIINAAQKFAAGALDQRVKVYSGDEIGILSNSFNVMANQLETTVAQLQDSQIMLRSFFESTRTCHVLMDTDLNAITFNKAAVDFGKKYYNIDLVPGTLVSKWVHAERLPGFIARCKTAMGGTLVEVETPVSYSNGETLWWSLVFEAARNLVGEVIGVSYHATDITQRVDQKREINSQHQSLERIAYIQSHEMRRPVASIIGLVDLFEQEDFTATKEELIMLKKAALELDEKIRTIVSDIH